MNKDDILLQIKMIENGIIPYALYDRKIKEGLSSMSRAEGIKMKRKFRKLWRKALHRQKDKLPYYKNLCASCGLGLLEKDLEPSHYRTRARLVLLELESQV